MKRLSDDPAVRLAECRGEVVPPAGAICDEVAPITEQAWRSLDSQPAGEVEVVVQARSVGDRNPSAWADIRDSVELEQMQRVNALCEARYMQNCYEFRELVDRDHVTRLQAENARLQAEFKDLLHTGVREDVFDVVCKEREALKAEVERLNKDWSDETAEHRITQVNRDTWRSNYHEAQSELTKARELLTTGRSVVRGSEYKLNGGIAWLYGVENFLARQTAPAAKGGE